MRYGKYIMVDDGLMTSPIIFPAWLQHADIARSVGGTVVSAGFVEFFGDENGNAHCEVHGESTSLKMGPGENDAKLIARSLGLG